VDVAVGNSVGEVGVVPEAAPAGFAFKVSGPFWPQAVKANDATTRINRAARVERPRMQAGLAWLATLTVKPC
jgi:hypothetical protein